MSNKTKTFGSLRKGDVFTLINSSTKYVKLGNHGARGVDGGRVLHDEHCIPAIYERCNFIGNLND